MNHFLEHYLTNKITPVKQDLSNIVKHFHTRTMLYKKLGLSSLTFQNAKVLEIGPGGGYNPLVTQSYGLGLYELVEPNEYAITDINNIFKKYNVDMSNITIHHTMLENFETDNLYDIIICEGMIPGLSNKNEVLSKIDSMTHENSIVIITCIDEVAFLFEILRYYIAQQLINDNLSFEEKLDIYEKAFTSHLETLKGMTRFKRDWCADSLFGLMHFNYDFSFKEAVEFYNDKYKFYNATPDLFYDLRWHKELPENNKEYNEYFLEQFNQQRHNLLLYSQHYTKRNVGNNKELVDLCKKISFYIYTHITEKKIVNDEIVKTLEAIILNLEDITQGKDKLHFTLLEIKDLIQSRDFNLTSISEKYENFKYAFGKGAFYVSFIKYGS